MDTIIERPLSSMPPGSYFTLPLGGGQYRLLYVNQCRACVEPANRVRKAVVASDGATLAEFDAPGGRQNWAPGTMVVPTVIQLEGSGVEVKMKTEILNPNFAVKLQPNIGRPAQKPRRQCDPATKRGRMLSILMDSLTGETPIADLMKEFSFTRSAVLTYCNEMNRDYGMGYELVNERVRVSFLPGVQPFKTTEDNSNGDQTRNRRQESVSGHKGRGAEKTDKEQERQVAAPRHDRGKLQDRAQVRRKARGRRSQRVHRGGGMK